MNNAVVNEDSNAKLIRELREEVDSLRGQLMVIITTKIMFPFYYFYQVFLADKKKKLCTYIISINVQS